jgi:hypothetical protein
LLKPGSYRAAVLLCASLATIAGASAQSSPSFVHRAPADQAAPGIKPLTFPTTIAPAGNASNKPAASAAKAAADGVQREIESKGWKQVNLPRPPVLDKTLRIAAAKADKAKADKAKADKAKAEKDKADARSTAKAGDARQAKAGEVVPGIPAVAPPQPKATGIFAMFTQGNPDAGETSSSDGAVVRPPAAAAAFAKVEGPSSRVASLSLANPLKAKPLPGKKNDDLEDEEDEDGPSPGGIRKQIASVETSCLPQNLLAMVKKTAEHFGGEAVITSGYRNRGRRGSYHRRCAAVDFQIPGVAASQIVAYLRKMPGAGGVGTYCHTKSVHLDTGTPRDWHQCLFHRRFALRTPVSE